jgi:hypothetical protein
MGKKKQQVASAGSQLPVWAAACVFFLSCARGSELVELRFKLNFLPSSVKKFAVAEFLLLSFYARTSSTCAASKYRFPQHLPSRLYIYSIVIAATAIVPLV